MSNFPIYPKLAVLTFAATALLFAGCSKSIDDYELNYRPSSGMNIEEKQGDTVLEGTIRFEGGNYWLVQADGSRQELESLEYSLSDYLDRPLQVTGQYSGNTLFVGKIQ